MYAPAAPEQRVALKPNSPFSASNQAKSGVEAATLEQELTRAAAAATPEERTKARVQLARFQLAQGNAAEAKAVLDVAIQQSPTLNDDPAVKLMRGSALVMLRRFDEAVKVLGAGSMTDNGEANLWRMVAEAGLGHIALARIAFRKGEPVLGDMSDDMQRIFRETMVEVSVAAQDFSTASSQVDALDALKLSAGADKRELLRGRIAEGFEQPAMALEAYRRAMDGTDEIAAAEAWLLATNLRYRMQEISRPEAIKALETLSAVWRGDGIEAEALASLTRLYSQDQRWRDAFTTMRIAMENHPDAPSTRDVQDLMVQKFTDLFLGEGAEAAPPTLESVALFYDFKELTPPGRNGDELIRKLADRLVEVDLLTQAADLLDYQIRNRLQGTARAQVAAHAAAIELMNRKPGRALNVLHDTRIANLPDDLVRSRLMLEARALSDLSRPDIALEMIAGYSGPDIARLRADVYWQAHRWQSAAEALELVAGESWKADGPLDGAVRRDVMRSAIGYALAEDPLGLDRLRAKFWAKLSATPDSRAFEVITSPDERGAEFQDLARRISMADTLRAFLDDYRKRYPENAPPQVKSPATAGGQAPPDRTADARG